MNGWVYVPIKHFFTKTAGHPWPTSHNCLTFVLDYILLLKKDTIFNGFTTLLSFVILAIQLCLKQYSINLSAFWVQRSIWIKEQSLANLPHGTCNREEHARTVSSSSTDAIATSPPHVLQVTPWLSLAQKEVDGPHDGSFLHICSRSGNPKWRILPSFNATYHFDRSISPLQLVEYFFA